jgi:UDP-N-acetyl-D-glucosamine dehydrogenase
MATNGEGSVSSRARQTRRKTRPASPVTAGAFSQPAGQEMRSGGVAIAPAAAPSHRPNAKQTTLSPALSWRKAPLQIDAPKKRTSPFICGGGLRTKQIVFDARECVRRLPPRQHGKRDGVLDLLQKFAEKRARIVVVGIGYVGLPLVAEFAREGFRVTGLDYDTRKVELLNQGESYIRDVPSSDLAPHVKSGLLDATAEPAVLREADAVVVCVPTPLNKSKDPDMRFIVDAAEQIAKHQHPNMLIVLESTTYPGTTTELLVPKLTENGFKLGKDVFVAFSPERVDPANEVFKTRNTPKVIGGATPGCLEAAKALYSHIIDTLVPVSSTEVAEMVKLQNTFRAVNIGLANEIALMSRKLGVNPFEVIRAAATKPFGFMPFYPGPGLGGHCIPVDPLYLSWKLKALKGQARFIELADSINSGMPSYVVERVTAALNEFGRSLKGCKVLVYGVAYKKNVTDVRESPAIEIIEELQKKGAIVNFTDPFVPSLELPHGEMVGVGADFGAHDLVVIVTDHDALDRDRLAREAFIIVDTRDALANTAIAKRERVFGL